MCFRTIYQRRTNGLLQALQPDHRTVRTLQGSGWQLLPHPLLRQGHRKGGHDQAMLVRELKICYDSHRAPLPKQLRTPRDAYDHLLPILGNEPVEIAVLLLLDTRHRLIGWHELARGTLDRTFVHPRDVFKAAILANASGLILAHNHPSGEATPSADDNVLTQRLKEAGTLLGIEILDHMIVGSEGYYSYKEQGRI